MQDERIDLSYIIGVIKRRCRLIQAMVFICIIGSAIITYLSVPTFISSINLRVTYATGANGTVGTQAPEELLRQQANTYIEILRSRTVIETVIRKMYGEEAVSLVPYEAFIGRIKPAIGKNTQIITISVAGNSPEEAQALANTLTEVFNERLTEITRSEGKDARIFIGQRLDEAKNDLAKVESSIVEYKKNMKTATVSDQTKNLLDRQAIVKKMVVDNLMALDAAEAKLANVNQQISRQSIGVIADSPLIQQLKNRLAEQEVELVGLQMNFTSNHPKVLSLRASVAETREKLNVEINKVVKAESPSSSPIYQGLLQNRLLAEADVAVGQAQSNALAKSNGTIDKEMVSLPDREQGLIRLMRDYTIAEDTYRALAKRYDQARIDEVMQPTNIQIVDKANLPQKQSSPRPVLSLAIAIALGLGLGIISAFIVDASRKTIDSAEDVKRYMGSRIIGYIPSYELYQKPEEQSLWYRFLNNFKRKNTERSKHG